MKFFLEPLLSTLSPSEPVQLSLFLPCPLGSCVVGLAVDSTGLLSAWQRQHSPALARGPETPW